MEQQDRIADLEGTEDEVLTACVSDEALEVAAGPRRAAVDVTRSAVTWFHNTCFCG
jgi:hypothetical protein